MANLKDIARQIKSVKNTQKTTKAMKLVSSSKLRKTQQLSEQAKSYSVKINDVLHELAYKVSKVQDEENLNRAFRACKDINVIDIVFVTADKGLCGGFNIATIRAVRELIKKYEALNVKNIRLRAIGKKGISYFDFQEVELFQKELGLSSAPTYEKTVDAVKGIFDDFKNGVTDKVILVHNGFLNMLSQQLSIKELLPINFENVSIEKSDSTLEIEPDDDGQILDELVSKYVDFNCYYSLIDSLTAEHSARMQAMDTATKNAKEKVDDLTVEFNKARQASITTELIEIISGVEALK